MSSTNFVSGFGESSKTSSKVLRPPGGGSSDIFGNDMPATPRSAKNHMASNIFGSDQSVSVKNNGDSARRAQKSVDSYSRLFGEPDRPFPLAKNHMKSSIPIGGNGEIKKNGTNGTSSTNSSSTTSNGHHYKNGNGKMENGSVSTTSSSEYHNGASRTENEKEFASKSEKETQALSLNDNNNNNNISNNSNDDDNNKSHVVENQANNNNNNNSANQTPSTEISESLSSSSPPPLSNSNNNNNNNNNKSNNSTPSPRSQISNQITNEHQNVDDVIANDENSLKTISETPTNQMNLNCSTNLNNNNDDDDGSKSLLSTTATVGSQPVNINKVINFEHGDHNNNSNQNLNLNDQNEQMKKHEIETIAAGIGGVDNVHFYKNQHQYLDGNLHDSNTTGTQMVSSTSYRHINMNNPNRSPRSFNSRNPVTGLGIEASNYKPRKWADHKDGNPVTGEGYKPAGGEINTTIPCLNGANQVINKNRIPPGGFSSGLW